MLAEAAVALDREQAAVTVRAVTDRIVNTAAGDSCHADPVPDRITRVFELADVLAWLGHAEDPSNPRELPQRAAGLVAETLREYGEHADGMAEGCACGDLTGRPELDAAEWWRREGTVARKVARTLLPS